MVVRVKETKTRTAAPSADEVRDDGGQRGYGDGGPVFIPARKPSPLARTLLASAGDGARVTAYDEIWYAGRPSA
jgi:hypothetical protein